MVKVQKRPNESVDELIKRFRYQVIASGIREEAAEKKIYRKPSEIRYEKKKQRGKEIKKLRYGRD